MFLESKANKATVLGARNSIRTASRRVLGDEEILHCRGISNTLKETIRIMTEIDEVIEKHGGWPGAFPGTL